MTMAGVPRGYTVKVRVLLVPPGVVTLTVPAPVGADARILTFAFI